ncbi:McrB family protein [Shewanella sp. SR44-3]|uniref:McrB family protein n=1 Tax=Shewanella sp. SR44-3 TaxID=2760936 RepID=UPI0015F92ABC|nr:AAA family ATPase [Shewanella sp. SR44-3]MBB1267909.1 AAA family ATPase [Shewanella sp. SR44-3]
MANGNTEYPNIEKCSATDDFKVFVNRKGLDKAVLDAAINVIHQANFDLWNVSRGHTKLHFGRKSIDETNGKVVGDFRFINNELVVCFSSKYERNNAKRIELTNNLAENQKQIEAELNSQSAVFEKNALYGKGRWPIDYGDASANVNPRVWKVSHSPSTFKKEELDWLEQNHIITVHENTGNGSASAFKEISEGDVVSLSYGGKVYQVVRVTSDVQYFEGPYFDNEWMMRKYEIIKQLDKPIQYQGNPKRWSPSFNGTSWEVPKKEFWMFEEEVLKPYYELTFEDLGFDTRQITKPENNSSNGSVETMNRVPLNQILYGPPGTGKTYHSIQAAVKAAEPKMFSALGIDESSSATPDQRAELTRLYKELYDAGRIKFVTFHQSYGYEEFVEGLSAKTEGDQLSYFEKDGVFKQICKVAKRNVEDSQKSTAKLKDESKFNQALEAFKLSMFDEADAYPLTESCSLIAIEEDGFRYGGNWNNTSKMKYDDLRSLYLEGVDSRQGIKKSDNVSGLAKQHASYYIRALDAVKACISEETSAVVTNKQNYVLIIDEINRGNISKIFGELITLIEPSKRLGGEEVIEVSLPYTGDRFSVPDNLYIIGTMNTADRSLALMDTALRRRFDFVEMMPDYNVLHNEEGLPFKLANEGFEIDLARLLETMNKRISALYDREHQLGHAFLMPVVKVIAADKIDEPLHELRNCFQNKIIPLLAEYFFEDWQKIRLVLGDNQKPEAYQLIKQSDVDYSALFGDSDEVSDLADGAQAFSLISNDSKLWQSVNTYIAIYDASQLPKIEA